MGDSCYRTESRLLTTAFSALHALDLDMPASSSYATDGLRLMLFSRIQMMSRWGWRERSRQFFSPPRVVNGTETAYREQFSGSGRARPRDSPDSGLRRCRALWKQVHAERK